MDGMEEKEGEMWPPKAEAMLRRKTMTEAIIAQMRTAGSILFIVGELLFVVFHSSRDEFDFFFLARGEGIESG